MSAQRQALLAWLVSSQSVDEATGVLTAAIDDTQSALWMELASWHELIDALELGEAHLAALLEEVLHADDPVEPTP